MGEAWLIAEHDAQQLIRDRWFAGMALGFALLALAAAVVGGSGPDVLRVSPFERTATALAVLAALFVPLLGLVLGAGWIAGLREHGLLAYLLAQPLSRATLFAGHVLGLALGVTSATLFGLGVAGLVVALQGGGAVPVYLVFCGLAALLALASLGVGLLISAVAATRSRALAAALLVWLFFTVVSDLLVLGVAATWRPSPEWLLALLGLSPAAVFRLGVLVSVTGTGDLAGPAAMVAVARFGLGGTVTLAAAVLAAWAAGAAGAGCWFFRRQADA